MQVLSPNGRIRVSFSLVEDGVPTFAVHRDRQAVIAPSRLGFELADQPPLRSDFRVERCDTHGIDERWETLWGTQRWVHHRGHALRVNLRERRPPRRRLCLELRSYDDGVAFRYTFPHQPGATAADEMRITEELSELCLTGDHLTWWQPGDWDSYEHLYDRCRFSEIDALSKRGQPDLLRSHIPANAVNTPVTMKTAEGLYLSFHEAALHDYAGMTLRVDPVHLRMVSALVGDADGIKVRTRAPWRTPWRTIQIAERPGDLLQSNLILNLNAPSRLGRPSWIAPMKYAGIWWEMHLGKSTWHLSDKHGATTDNAKRYVDFCAETGIEALLVEGWNTGWERWQDLGDREGLFDFITSYPDYDLEEVVRYAAHKGVRLVMHHETAGAVRTYEAQLERAFQRCRELGIHAVKTGYVGEILPPGEHHHGQWMVRHYQHVLERAAAYELMLDVHEPIKPTGIQRTWPNLMTCEGVRGQEFNAWSSEGGNPPEHLVRVAFTRMLAGPVDYTPGIVKPRFAPHRPRNRLRHTLAHELAAYVVLYSPMQMVADLPEHYVGHPALTFIRDVPVDWDVSHVLEAELGEHVTIARKQRGREAWFIGSITGEWPRTLQLPLGFLRKGQRYAASLYTDMEGASWRTSPEALAITRHIVDRDSTLTLKLAAGGGAAVSLHTCDPEGPTPGSRGTLVGAIRASRT